MLQSCWHSFILSLFSYLLWCFFWRRSSLWCRLLWIQLRDRLVLWWSLAQKLRELIRRLILRYLLFCNCCWSNRGFQTVLCCHRVTAFLDICCCREISWFLDLCPWANGLSRVLVLLNFLRESISRSIVLQDHLIWMRDWVCRRRNFQLFTPRSSGWILLLILEGRYNRLRCLYRLLF